MNEELEELFGWFFESTGGLAVLQEQDVDLAPQPIFRHLLWQRVVQIDSEELSRLCQLIVGIDHFDLILQDQLGKAVAFDCSQISIVHSWQQPLVFGFTSLVEPPFFKHPFKVPDYLFVPLQPHLD